MYGVLIVGSGTGSDTLASELSIDNLYVCGCSVIPRPPGLPSIMTTCALAKRLSKHLESL